MTGVTRPTAGQANAAFVSWLVTGAVGPAFVALPVNLVADKLAGAAVRWFKRLRQTDDLSRLVKAAAGDLGPAQPHRDQKPAAVAGRGADLAPARCRKAERETEGADRPDRRLPVDPG